MAKYEVNIPGRGKFEVTGPDGMSDDQVIAAVNHEPSTWGQYAGGLARQAAQGLSFGFADEAEAGARSLFGGGSYSDIVGDIRQQNQRFAEENPIASTVANIGGGIVPFAAGPGAGLARLAVGSTLPRTMARSAALGAPVGALSGLGAGEGDLAERLPSAAHGAGTGFAVGGLAPPVIGGAGWLLGQAGRLAAPLFEGARRTVRPPTEPPFEFSATGPRSVVEGATFAADGAGPAEVAGAQTRALELLRDQLLRSGRSVQDVEAELQRLAGARTYHSTGEAQDATVLADLVPAWQRLAGSMGRQSPEAAADMAQITAARQTGLAPAGTTARELAQRGVPTRERFAAPLTAEQAERQLGSSFKAGEGNIVPMGHWERVKDALKRALRIKDSDYHGHAADPGRTEAQILAAARQEAQGLYGAAYKASEGVDLRPVIQPVIDRWTTRMADEPEPVARAIRGMLRLFETKAGTVSRLERFDKAKQFADGQIERWLEAPEGRNRYVGGLLGELRRELLTAVDAVPNAGTAYAQARAAFSDRMRARDVLRMGRDAWKEDADVGADAFAALTEGEQRLFRLGMLWGFERQTGSTEGSRQITNTLSNPRIGQLLSSIIERSDARSAAFRDRPERFGRYVDFERRMAETRNVALGGSSTARNLQDDMTTAAMEATQSVSRLKDLFSGNTSLFQLGERLLVAGYDRIFGVGADAAREAVRMLFTANPQERQAILTELARIMPATRMERFNELLRRMQGTAGAPLAGAIGGAAGATPQPGSGGPVSF